MRFKFAAKLTIVFGLSTICVTTFAIGLLYKRAQSAVHHEISSKMIDVAISTTQVIDPADHLVVQKTESRHSDSYKRISEGFKRLRRANPRIKHIYTLAKTTNQDQLKFVIDSGAQSAPLAAIGCPLNTNNHPNMLGAFDNPTADMQVRTDRRGSWLSAYAPIRDETGETIAILGIDMDAKSALREERALGVAATLAFSFTLALTLIISVIVAVRISRPMRQLTDATRHIADGNLDYTISIDSKDEIGELANSFNQMISSLKETQGRLMKRANTDGLTELYNHRYFQERLGQELRRSVRYGRPLALIMIDVDGFKQINDTLGHPAGDTILRKIAEIIASNVREIDIPTRYGGDEFAIILPETDQDEALLTAERIRSMVEQQSPTETLKNQEHDHKMTLSIGVAVCPKHAKQKDSLLAAADIAMYHAKHVSQNAVCSYDTVPGAGSTMDPCRIHAFLQSASVATIAALATAVDAKDHYTKGHSEAVAKYAVGIAQELHLSDEDKFSVRIAALLHDVGKIGMPDTILKNPGALSGEQREIVRSHPSIGERIVKQVPQLQKILPGILYHHERFDGTGYPCGLVGSRIPPIARIICVADAFDAMTSNRPYREALAVEVAVRELQVGSGGQFDPSVVSALIRWLKSQEDLNRAA